MLRVIQECKPTWVLGENVAGIVNMELESLLSEMEGVGYEVQPIIIPACAVDAPHRRDRVWILAHSNGERLEGVGPGPKPSDQARNEQRGQIGGVFTEKPIADSNIRGEPFGGEAGRMGRKEYLSGPGYWKATSQPFVRRGSHGIPDRSHRIKGLGNAIVPQVAYEILKLMI